MGSATAIPHSLTGIDLTDIEKVRKELSVGMPVRAVFKERGEREGRITDFRIELEQ